MTTLERRSALAWLEQRAVQLTHGLTVVGFAALLFLALATVADITGRFAFKRPLHGVGDLAAAMMAVIVVASFPACFADKRNIGVDLLGRTAGPAVQRCFDAFGHVASLAFVSVFAWQLARYANDIGMTGQTTSVLRLPLAPWWWVAAALAVLTVPVQLIVTVRALADMVARGTRSQDDGSAGKHA